MRQISRIVLFAFVGTLLVGCVTEIRDSLPQQQSPQVVLAADFGLVVSPSHPAAVLPAKPIKAGTEVSVIATDKDAAWLLVESENLVGWLPTFYSHTNIATLEPALIIDSPSSECTKFLGTTMSPDERWVSNQAGAVIVQGAIYRARSTNAFAAATLQLLVEGGSRAMVADYLDVPLTSSTAIVLFAFSVTDVQPLDTLHFALTGTGGESVSFEAAFFSDSCNLITSNVGRGFQDLLPIGQATMGHPAPLPAESDVVSLLPTVTPTPASTLFTPTPTARRRSAVIPSPTEIVNTPTPRVISVTSGPRSSPGAGVVNVEILNVRSGPDVTFPIIHQLEQGTNVAIMGTDANRVWWQIELANEASGWVNGEFVDVKGCRRCLPVVETPLPAEIPPSAEVSVSQPAEVSQPAQPSVELIASNRSDFNGTQSFAGWKYLQESARNSGQWIEMSYDGSCYRATSWEKDVRICAEGEVHPGQSTRIAYEWRPDFHGDIQLSVHAHKIDTTCGDGIWVGIYRARDGVGFEQELGTLQIVAEDNQGITRTYASGADPGNLFYIVVDIRGNSTCDLTRIYVDISESS